MQITTTLDKLREHNPCTEGWKKALRFLGKTVADNEPLPLLTILESNGFDDALWALRTIDSKYDNALRLFACFCARYSLHTLEEAYPYDTRQRAAIETVERYARGEVGKEEIEDALAYAWATTTAGAWAARAATGAGAWDDAWACLINEFKRLCLLDGEYGKVVKES